MDRAESGREARAEEWLAAEMAARGVARVYGNRLVVDEEAAETLIDEWDRYMREWDYVPSFMLDEHGQILPQVSRLP